ncbi:MAG: rhomboid family intramembrane serine protease [Acidobacteria bacterium]|jgi:membrane associated rhomboid family serine protease|nr:MAG: rhomboid family intramembrane serine protease [Acidobacteriota bacterium]
MIPIRDDQPRFSTPYLNYFIIGLNVIAFLFELSIGSNNPRALNAFIDEFGVVPSYFTHALEGNAHASLAAGLLSILTSMFLHGSWLHIIGNMWALYIFGDNIEDRLGHGTYLAFYLICGFAASFTHILLNLGSNVPSVGASGAIAGVMGAYFVLYPRSRVLTIVPLIVFFTFWWLPAWIVLGYWFIVQFFSGAATSIAYTNQSTGGVAFWAHVGGFVAGILLIKIFPQRKGRNRYGTW